jgi:hypothetical protein
MLFGWRREEASHTRRVDLTTTTTGRRWNVTAQRNIVLSVGISCDEMRYSESEDSVPEKLQRGRLCFTTL